MPKKGIDIAPYAAIDKDEVIMVVGMHCKLAIGLQDRNRD